MKPIRHNFVLPLVLAAGLFGSPLARAEDPGATGGGGAGFGAQMNSPAEAPSMGQPSGNFGGSTDMAPAREFDQGQSSQPQFEPQQGQRQQLTPDEVLGQKPNIDPDPVQKDTDVFKPKTETKPGDFESQAGKVGQVDVTKPKTDVDPMEGTKTQIPDKVKIPDQAKDPDKAPDQAKTPDKDPDQAKTPDKDKMQDPKDQGKGKGQDPWDGKDHAKGKGKHDDHWGKGKKGGVVWKYHPTAVVTYIHGRPVCGWKKVTECTEKKVLRNGKRITIETCVDRKKPVFCY